jgi:Ran GTPase-activating protein (RanGAP) involved in mRNA processing and transport
LFISIGLAAIADAIRDMGALAKLDISKNYVRAEGGRALAVGLKGNQVMTELNIAGNLLTLNDDSAAYDDMSGVTAVANTISGMGAILSVNLLKNNINIGVEQARALVSILKEHPTLKSLCGNNGDETELDMSGKMAGAEDALMLAVEIVDNGALSSLNLSSNMLTGRRGDDMSGNILKQPV